MTPAGWDPAAVATLVALLGAWLALDETALAQTWFAQPLPAATLAAWLLGRPDAGLLVGLPFQLLTIGNLPVGQSFVGDKGPPTVGCVAAVVATGFLGPEPAGNALGAGPVAARVGWLLVLLALAVMAGHRLVRLERAWNARRGTATLRALRDGRSGHLDRLQALCLATTALRGAVTALAVFALVRTLWLPAFDLLPARAREGAALLPWLTGALGLGALADLYASRAGVRWLIGAFVLALTGFLLLAARGGAA